MSTMTDRQSLAANTSSANVLAGKLNEFISVPSVVRLYAQASAVGLNSTFLVAGVSQIQDQEIGALNRMPIVPDDLVVSCVAPVGARLALYFRNTTGGAITAFSRVDVDPL